MSGKSMRAAAILLTALGSGCVRTPPQELRVLPLPLRIIPDHAGPVGFCRLAGDNLIVRLHNPNGIPVPAANVSVTYSTTPETTRSALGPQIGPHSNADVPVAFPSACFRPDCHFLIRVQESSTGTVQAPGTCIG